MTEKLLKLPSGWLFVPVFLLVLPGAVATLIVLAVREHNFLPYGLAAVFVGVGWARRAAGVPGGQPERGSRLPAVRQVRRHGQGPGFYYGNPFYWRTGGSPCGCRRSRPGMTKTDERKDAARQRGDGGQHAPRMPSKVNDKDGTPIEIAAIIVWRVVNTAEAVFQVDDFQDFVHLQSEAALRNLASHYSYDARGGGVRPPRGHIDEVTGQLNRGPGRGGPGRGGDRGGPDQLPGLRPARSPPRCSSGSRPGPDRGPGPDRRGGGRDGRARPGDARPQESSSWTRSARRRW